MKIALIAPGIREVPPLGWDAVGILIWDYYQELIELGQEVEIINQMRRNPEEQINPYTEYCEELITRINSVDYDFVHIHYDVLYHLIPYLRCPRIGITSHYPYIDQLNRHNEHYRAIFRFISNNQEHFIFALSEKDKTAFIESGADPQNIIMSYNGSNHRAIQPVRDKKYPQRAVCIGKVEPRKRQYLLEKISCVDFYGPCEDAEFQSQDWFQQRWKGEVVGHDHLMKLMADYGSMVLLSDGENGTPLVVKEALMAGLPLVISEFNTNDIDTSLPFISVIEEDRIQDSDYVQSVIELSLDQQHYQQAIREYGIQHFSWEQLVGKYLENINEMPLIKRKVLSTLDQPYRKCAKQERSMSLKSQLKYYLRKSIKFLCR